MLLCLTGIPNWDMLAIQSHSSSFLHVSVLGYTVVVSKDVITSLVNLAHNLKNIHTFEIPLKWGPVYDRFIFETTLNVFSDY